MCAPGDRSPSRGDPLAGDALRQRCGDGAWRAPGWFGTALRPDDDQQGPRARHDAHHLSHAHGLPNSEQRTTARDQARLGIALRQHFPQYYDYFSTRSFRFGKQTIGNHNRLLGNVRGVDGIKTGYTRASGFNLVTSAQLDGRSIVAVVMGGTSGGARDAQMRKLVAKYMPSASRRGSGNLIAEVPAEPMTTVAEAEVRPATAAAVASAAMDLPNTGPVPDFRYTGESAAGVAMAYASTKPASDNPVLAAKIAPNTLDSQIARLAQEPEAAGDVDTQITNSVATAETAPAAAEASTEANSACRAGSSRSAPRPTRRRP